MSCRAKGCNREMEWDEDNPDGVCREHGTHEDVMNACEDCINLIVFMFSLFAWVAYERTDC